LFRRVLRLNFFVCFSVYSISQISLIFIFPALLWPTQTYGGALHVAVIGLATLAKKQHQAESFSVSEVAAFEGQSGIEIMDFGVNPEVIEVHRDRGTGAVPTGSELHNITEIHPRGHPHATASNPAVGSHAQPITGNSNGPIAINGVGFSLLVTNAATSTTSPPAPTSSMPATPAPATLTLLPTTPMEPAVNLSPPSDLAKLSEALNAANPVTTPTQITAGTAKPSSAPDGSGNANTPFAALSALLRLPKGQNQIQIQGQVLPRLPSILSQSPESLAQQTLSLPTSETSSYDVQIPGLPFSLPEYLIPEPTVTASPQTESSSSSTTVPPSSSTPSSTTVPSNLPNPSSLPTAANQNTTSTPTAEPDAAFDLPSLEPIPSVSITTIDQAQQLMLFYTEQLGTGMFSSLANFMTVGDLYSPMPTLIQSTLGKVFDSIVPNQQLSSSITSQNVQAANQQYGDSTATVESMNFASESNLGESSVANTNFISSASPTSAYPSYSVLSTAAAPPPPTQPLPPSSPGTRPPGPSGPTTPNGPPPPNSAAPAPANPGGGPALNPDSGLGPSAVPPNPVAPGPIPDGPARPPDPGVNPGPPGSNPSSDDRLTIEVGPTGYVPYPKNSAYYGAPDSSIPLPLPAVGCVGPINPIDSPLWTPADFFCRWYLQAMTFAPSLSKRIYRMFADYDVTATTITLPMVTFLSPAENSALQINFAILQGAGGLIAGGGILGQALGNLEAGIQTEIMASMYRDAFIETLRVPSSGPPKTGGSGSRTNSTSSSNSTQAAAPTTTPLTDIGSGSGSRSANSTTSASGAASASPSAANSSAKNVPQYFTYQDLQNLAQSSRAARVEAIRNIVTPVIMKGLISTMSVSTASSAAASGSSSTPPSGQAQTAQGPAANPTNDPDLSGLNTDLNTDATASSAAAAEGEESRDISSTIPAGESGGVHPRPGSPGLPIGTQIPTAAAATDPGTAYTQLLQVVPTIPPNWSSEIFSLLSFYKVTPQNVTRQQVNALATLVQSGKQISYYISQVNGGIIAGTGVIIQALGNFPLAAANLNTFDMNETNFRQYFTQATCLPNKNDMFNVGDWDSPDTKNCWRLIQGVWKNTTLPDPKNGSTTTTRRIYRDNCGLKEQSRVEWGNVHQWNQPSYGQVNRAPFCPELPISKDQIGIPHDSTDATRILYEVTQDSGNTFDGNLTYWRTGEGKPRIRDENTGLEFVPVVEGIKKNQ